MFYELNKNKIVLSIIILITIMLPCKIHSQQLSKSDWSAYKFLLGEWIGEGSGQPGEGIGTTTVSLDLNDQILIRKNHVDYNASNDRPAFSHDDLMIFYNENNSTRVIYFDNEGHVIHYKASFAADSSALYLTGDITAGAPRFRFTYIKLNDIKIKVMFEIAPPDKPEQFMKYVEGVIKKKI